MSTSRGNGQNGGHFYSNITQPVKIDCSFIVDSSNVNGLGIRSLKSNGYIENVYMNVENGAVGTPAMGLARTYAAFGASAVTNTGSSVLTGNLGIYPGTSVTGFPPGTFTGVLNVANAAALQAKTAAQAAYTDLQGRASTVIATALDGQALTAGVYSSASGTFTLAQAGAGTLTLTGSATDIFVFKTATTLTTGAGGIPTITLAGGALASNVYWVVGTATINSGFTGTFKGNIIANTSITDTLGGTVNGSLIALNGAVTLSAATNINVQALTDAFVAAGNPNPAPGYALFHFTNNYKHYLGAFNGFTSPLSGTNVAINATNLTVGQAYVISVVGTSTLANWQAVGLPVGFTPTVGQSFIATATGSAGTGQVQVPLVSGVNSVEVVGTADTLLNNASIAANGGAWVLVQFLSNSVLGAPADGSTANMSFFFDISSVTIDGL